MVSGLKVTFFKSSISIVNLKAGFLEAAFVFLNCAVNSLPLKFLGIMVGDSPRKTMSWKSVVEVLRKILVVWRGRNLYIGGRVVLINLVLNVLPIFTLSFYKADVLIIKEIIKIQSIFLWGGTYDLKHIHWINWKTICLSKDKGGLGIKNIPSFNKSLLLKGKWRFILEE